jgi:hypothetical protein
MAHPGRTLIAGGGIAGPSRIAPQVSGTTGSMAEDDDQVKPSEQRGGTNAGDAEIREKGDWVDAASEGVVPAELGGSDAPESGPDPDYDDAALGRTTGSEVRIDPAAGDAADATTDGGPERPADAEPDLKDAPTGPRAADRESAG